MRALPPVRSGPGRPRRRRSRAAGDRRSRAVVHRDTAGDPRRYGRPDDRPPVTGTAMGRPATISAVATITPVDDPADPRLDDFRDLTAADRRPDRPGGRGLVIAEGVVVVRRLVDSPYPVRSLLGRAAPARRAGRRPGRARRPGLRRPTPRRWPRSSASTSTAACSRWPTGPPPPDLAALLRTAPGCVAVLEGVNDHENLGALFRNAAALGVDARAARPALRRPALPAQRPGLDGARAAGAVRRAARPVAGGARRLRAAGLRVAALTPAADAVPLTGAGLAGQRVALLLGAEGPGLSAEALAAADLRVRIPMAPGVDSLNVATAAAVAFHVGSAARRLNGAELAGWRRGAARGTSLLGERQPGDPPLPAELRARAARVGGVRRHGRPLGRPGGARALRRRGRQLAVRVADVLGRPVDFTDPATGAVESIRRAPPRRSRGAAPSPRARRRGPPGSPVAAFAAVAGRRSADVALSRAFAEAFGLLWVPANLLVGLGLAPVALPAAAHAVLALAGARRGGRAGRRPGSCCCSGCSAPEDLPGSRRLAGAERGSALAAHARAGPRPRTA